MNISLILLKDSKLSNINLTFILFFWENKVFYKLKPQYISQIPFISFILYYFS